MRTGSAGTDTVSMPEVSLAWLKERAELTPCRLYAVIDSCDEVEVAQRADMVKSRAVSLYRGWAEQEQWAFAPYLFAVDQELLDWIVARLWEKPWGFFVLARFRLEDVRRHLRHFLIVEDPSGRRVYFRYYDPRVLRTFLLSSQHADRVTFLGDLDGIVFSDSDESGRRVLRHFANSRSDQGSLAVMPKSGATV